MQVVRRKNARTLKCGDHDRVTLHPLLDDKANIAIEAADWRTLGMAAIDAIHLSDQIRIHVGRPAKAVIGLRELLARNGLNHIRRDQHDELGFVLQIVAAAEKRAKDRQALQSGITAQRLLRLIGEEAGHDQRAAARQLDHGLGAAHLKGRDGDVRQNDRTLIRELADLRRNFQTYAPFRHDHRSEGEADAKFLELYGNRAELLRDGNRKLTASKEICGLAGDRRQIRFGQGVQQTILFKSTQNRLHTIFPRQPLDAAAGHALTDADGASQPPTLRRRYDSVGKEWRN